MRGKKNPRWLPSNDFPVPGYDSLPTQNGDLSKRIAFRIKCFSETEICTTETPCCQHKEGALVRSGRTGDERYPAVTAATTACDRHRSWPLPTAPLSYPDYTTTALAPTRTQLAPNPTAILLKESEKNLQLFFFPEETEGRPNLIKNKLPVEQKKELTKTVKLQKYSNLGPQFSLCYSLVFSPKWIFTTYCLKMEKLYFRKKKLFYSRVRILSFQ